MAAARYLRLLIADSVRLPPDEASARSISESAAVDRRPFAVPCEQVQCHRDSNCNRLIAVDDNRQEIIANFTDHGIGAPAGQRTRPR
jgi:hypothetical protein